MSNFVNIRESSTEEKERMLSNILHQACSRPLLLDERKNLSQILRLTTDGCHVSDSLLGSLQVSPRLHVLFYYLP
ncbi:hypothetical protein EON65_19975 [archaeon]|nr:MAG: hypothetical protein EON65_19975 [archaeon]